VTAFVRNGDAPLFDERPTHRQPTAMTPEQQALLTALRAIADRHGWSSRCPRIEIAAGPRAFDVRCSDDGRTIWHRVGTADQIAGALGQWVERRVLTLAR
jgi:hypothetical protein